MPNIHGIWAKITLQISSGIGLGIGITKILESGIGIGITNSGIGIGIGITKKSSDSDIPGSKSKIWPKILMKMSMLAEEKIFFPALISRGGD